MGCHDWDGFRLENTAHTTEQVYALTRTISANTVHCAIHISPRAMCLCVRAVAMCVVVRTHCVSYMHFFAMHTRICATQEDRECRDDNDDTKRRAELGRSMRTRTRTHACSIIVIILKRYLRRVCAAYVCGLPLRIAKQTRFTVHACEAYTTNNTPAPRRLARRRSVH